jgi:excinuclease ABC subunit B
MTGGGCRARDLAAKHFVMPKEKIDAALERIGSEMDARLRRAGGRNKLMEAQRLRQRTEFDLEMLREWDTATASRTTRATCRTRTRASARLHADYFDSEVLTIIDESHVTCPTPRHVQRRPGEHCRPGGPRLQAPSAKDNRPLNFDEFLAKVGTIVFTSATPGEYERRLRGHDVQ